MFRKSLFLLFLIFTFVFGFCQKASARYYGPTWGDKGELSVYIPENNTYTPDMKQAFQKWQKSMYDKIKFVFVNKPDKDTDVVVIFSDKVDGTDGDVGSYATTIKGGLIVKGEITLATEGTSFSRDLIYTTMLHEIGHILGLPDSKRNIGIMKSPVDEKQDIISNDIVILYRFNNWSTMDPKFDYVKQLP